MRAMLYIVGEPGVGKSTLMRALTDGHTQHQQLSPVPHIIYGDGDATEIGVSRGAFSGTDGLAMSIQPRIEEWLMQRPYRQLLAEGDRLANAKFFRAVRDAGYELRLVHLAGSEVAATRRASRASEMHFAPQDPAWVKGRQTKVQRLSEAFNALVLDAAEPPDGWLQVLRDGGWNPLAPEPIEVPPQPTYRYESQALPSGEVVKWPVIDEVRHDTPT
jgi:energy-coupling factor transporter ATP-binding protein EcfA2